MIDQYEENFAQKVAELSGDEDALFEFFFGCAFEAQSSHANIAGARNLQSWPRADLIKRLERKAVAGIRDEWVYRRFYDLCEDLHLPFRPVLQTDITA